MINSRSSLQSDSQITLPKQQAPSSRFFRSGSIFVLMMFAGSVFEIAFTALTAYLPGTGYETVNALFNIFFILIAPLAGIQFMVGKEVSAFSALNAPAKARAFVTRTFIYVIIGALWIASVGVGLSPRIAHFLNISSVTPVMLLMGVFLCYAPFPVFYGTVQGLKRFFHLGMLQFFWGFVRFGAAGIAILLLSGGVNTLLIAVIGAMAISSLIALISASQVFSAPRGKIAHEEFSHAYSLVVPIIVTMFFMMILKNMDIILAKKFFDSAEAQAYTCAARVGSGFFSLTGIIMVMFPHVSEEKTLGRNPIIFLFKSLAFTLGLSAIGLVIAGLAPGLVMNIITLGKDIPGATSLIRPFGFAILPLAMTYIMANYLLAKHYAGFLPILFTGVIGQITVLWLARSDPRSLLSGLGTANTMIFLAMLFYVVIEHRRFIKDRSGALDPV